MKYKNYIRGTCITLALGISAAVNAGPTGPDTDCSMCHDSAPVPADHMEVDEVSVESCMMCHETDGQDPFFRTLHEKHGEELGCDSCHEDASDERKAKLNDMLGN